MSLLDAYNAGKAARRAAATGMIVAASSGMAATSQGAPNIPPVNYGPDQPTLITATPEFRTGYHDHQFTAGITVFSFDGFDISAARAAISEHDTGVSFYRSSLLSVALTRFAPVAAALAIRVAPSIAIARQIKGGTRGLAKKCADEVRAQLCPSDGLLPSECFPSTLWGALAIEAAMMGFAVMQHVYGPADDGGRRRIYTRRWPTWAARYDSWRRTYIAITTAGEIDICDDGKFTLIGKTDVPHLQGAVRALAFPVLDGAQVQQARAQWINRYSDPKLVAYMPKGVQVNGPEGLAFMRCLQSLRNPGGFGALPDGSSLQAIGLDSKASASFKEALDSDIAMIYAVLTGTDLSAGTGGVYTSPLFGDILRATVGDDLAAQNRGVNQGHVAPYIRFNYAAAVAIDTARGVWVDPVLSTPLPDPEADARIDSKAKRMAALVTQVAAEKAAGADMTQDRVIAIAAELEVEPFILAAQAPGAQSFGHDQENGIVTINQRLAELGKPLDDTGRGAMTVPEYREHLAALRAQREAQTGITEGALQPVDPNQQPAQPEENAA